MAKADIPVIEETKIEVKLIKNIKYGENPYKAGQKIDIDKKDLEEFKAAGVIAIEEE